LTICPTPPLRNGFFYFSFPFSHRVSGGSIRTESTGVSCSYLIPRTIGRSRLFTGLSTLYGSPAFLPYINGHPLHLPLFLVPSTIGVFFPEKNLRRTVLSHCRIVTWGPGRCKPYSCKTISPHLTIPSLIDPFSLYPTSKTSVSHLPLIPFLPLPSLDGITLTLICLGPTQKGPSFILSHSTYIALILHSTPPSIEKS